MRSPQPRRRSSVPQESDRGDSAAGLKCPHGAAPSPSICMIGQRAPSPATLRRPQRPPPPLGVASSRTASRALFCFNYLLGPAGALVWLGAIPGRCWTPAIAHNRRLTLTAKALSIYPATLYEGAARRFVIIAGGSPSSRRCRRRRRRCRYR